MDDVGDALAFQEGGRFFAADAAGAEHRDALAGEQGGMRAPPAGKIAEAGRMRVHRAGEAAITDLALVAGVDDDGAGVVDYRIPVGGRHIGSPLPRRAAALPLPRPHFPLTPPPH